MSINLINKSNTVFSSIKLQHEFLYVSASNDCNFLSDLDITPTSGQILPGIYGDVKESNLKIRDNRLYQINNSFYDSNNNTIEKISNVKDSIADLESTFDNEYQTLVANYPNNNNILDDFLTLSKGIRFNFKKTIAESEGISSLNNKFSFKTEKIKKEYLIDSDYFYKKNAIKNIFKYYKEDIKQNFETIINSNVESAISSTISQEAGIENVVFIDISNINIDESVKCIWISGKTGRRKLNFNATDDEIIWNDILEKKGKGLHQR